MNERNRSSGFEGCCVQSLLICVSLVVYNNNKIHFRDPASYLTYFRSRDKNKYWSYERVLSSDTHTHPHTHIVSIYSSMLAKMISLSFFLLPFSKCAPSSWLLSTTSFKNPLNFIHRDLYLYAKNYPFIHLDHSIHFKCSHFPQSTSSVSLILSITCHQIPIALKCCQFQHPQLYFCPIFSTLTYILRFSSIE